MVCKKYIKQNETWIEYDKTYRKEEDIYENGQLLHKTYEGWEKCEVTIPDQPDPPVNIIDQPDNASIKEYGTATFTVVAENATTYLWQRNGVDIDTTEEPSAATAEYTTGQMTVADDNGAVFRCVCSNDTYEVISDPASLTVTVVDPPVPTFDGPEDVSVSVGGVGTFEITNVQNASSYQWRKNGLDIEGATSTKYTTPVTTLDDDGNTYSVVVSNSHHSKVSDPATLSVTTTQCTPLSGDAAVFLQAPAIHSHTNSGKTVIMESLPEDKVFPEGQRIYVGGYEMGQRNGDKELPENANMHQQCADHGFTVAGPHGGVASLSKLDAAKNATCPDGFPMMYMPLIREINGYGGGKPIAYDCFVDGTKASGACMGDDPVCTGYTTIGQDAVNKWATGSGKDPASGMKRWMDYDNEYVYGWMYCLDDCRTKLRVNTTNQTYQAMTDYDAAHAPSWANGARVVGDFGLQDSYYPDSSTTRQRLEKITCTISQNYYHGGDYAGDGDGFHKSRLMISKWAQTLESMCAAVPPISNKPRLIIQGWLWAFSWDAVVEHNGDQAYYEKEYMHDMLLAMMSGCNGLHFYQMREPNISEERTICQQEWSTRKDALFASLKKIAVDQDVLKALVWGKRTGHSAAISATASPKQKYGNDSELEDDALTVADIQFRRKRYVILTNSQQREEVTQWWDNNPDGVVSGQNNPGVANGDCDAGYRTTWGKTTPSYWHWYQNEAPNPYGFSTVLSGFPTDLVDGKRQIKVTNIVTGEDVTDDVFYGTPGSLTVQMNPLDSAVFVIEPADGFCGGEEPDTQLPLNATPADFQQWVSTVTYAETLVDVPIDDARWSNRSKGEGYAYENDNYIVFYTPNALHANFDMDGFSPVDKALWYDFTGGNGGPIDIGLAQPINYDTGDGAYGGVIYAKVNA